MAGIRLLKTTFEATGRICEQENSPRHNAGAKATGCRQSHLSGTMKVTARLGQNQPQRQDLPHAWKPSVPERYVRP